MKSPFTTITREANAWMKKYGIPHRGKFTCIGSFFAFRINDPDGKVTVAEATLIERNVTSHMIRAGLQFQAKNIGAAHHMGGVVINWEMA